MAIRITYNGYTLINIQDGVFGTNIIGNSTNTSTYNFLTGFIGSYLEGVVLNLAGDKNAGSAAIYFMEDYYNNKTLNFTYDNKTGTLQIHTENNTDYMITLCSNGAYTYMIMNSRNSSKNLKTTTAETNIIITKEICGGYGSIGYGYNYENAATWTISDFITKGIESIYNFGKNYITYCYEQTIPDSATDTCWKIINTCEDIAGSILITTGITLAISSAPVVLPIAAVAGGALLCYAATGANSLDDISNPYYAENAAISIFMSCLPGSGEVKIARIAEKALHKQVTIATRTVLCNKGLTTYSSYLHEYAKTFETGVGCSAFVECCRYHPMIKIG